MHFQKYIPTCLSSLQSVFYLSAFAICFQHQGMHGRIRCLKQYDAQELEDRNKFLEALTDKYTVSGLPEPGPLPELAPLLEDEAIILIQANERGRQARERAQTMRTFKRQRQLEDRRARSGVVRPTLCFARSQSAALAWHPSLESSSCSLTAQSHALAVLLV